MLKEVTEMKEEKKGYSRRSFLKKGAWIGTIATMIPAVVGNAAAIQLPTSPPAESGRDDPNIVPTTLSPCPFCGSRRVEMSRTKKKNIVLCRNCGGRTREASDDTEAARRWNVRESLFETMLEIREEIAAIKKGRLLK